jgi:hypothetical protein
MAECSFDRHGVFRLRGVQSCTSRAGAHPEDDLAEDRSSRDRGRPGGRYCSKQ